MRTKSILICSISVLILWQCTQKADEPQSLAAMPAKSDFGGFENQQKWGEHLVTIAGCHDCHTPKKMSAGGLDLDSSLLLSGHQANSPFADMDRREIESKGLAVTGDLTRWVGPWGISYTANLTSDSTGIGNWKEDQFIYALRQGKYKGLADSRPLLPPMPWAMYKNMTDDELKAIFAYLKSTKPVRNQVPPPQPPVSGAPQAKAGQRG